MSTAEFYDELAPLYHLNYEAWQASVQRQALALDQILRRRGVMPGSSVLDAACGIGTQSVGLATLGYRVTGSDLSPGAVARAREEAASLDLPIEFSVADLRLVAEHHQRQFDVVIACDNAIPHLLSDSDILAAFEQLHRCTAAGGLCLVSVRDYAKEDFSAPLQALTPIVHAEGDSRRILFQVWEVAGEQYELSIYIVTDDRQSEPAVRVMRTRYYAVSIDTLLQLMRRAGFEELERLDEPFFQPVIVGQRPRL